MFTDQFTELADENRMEYNIDNCKSTTFEGKLALSDPLLLKGNVIPTVESIKDVGIIISYNTTWNNHIQNKLVAAGKAYHFLKRTVPYSLSPSTKLMYYRLCVQRILLYRSQLWCPSINFQPKVGTLQKTMPILGYWVTKLFTATGSIEYATYILE